jgi:hypothetical protein
MLDLRCQLLGEVTHHQNNNNQRQQGHHDDTHEDVDR